MSFSHFLSADDHMCAGFSQALGTSVCSHPLSLLSSAYYLIQHKYLVVCKCVCVKQWRVLLSYTLATLSGWGVNESWRVRGHRGDGYNVARVSHESPFQLSKLCEVYFGIFDSKCERAVFQHMSFPTASIVLHAFSLFRGDCLLSLILCSVVGGWMRV